MAALWACRTDQRYRPVQRLQKTAQHATVSTGVIGLALMLLALLHLLGEAFEITLTTLGVVLVMVAHIRNLHAGHDHTRADEAV